MNLPRRASRFVIVVAHVAILGMLFQVAAFDHWGPHDLDVFGVEGSATHVHSDHCHGDSAGCAGAGSATAGAVQGAGAIRLPSPAFLKVTAFASQSGVTADAFLAKPFQPPRTA